MCAREQIRGVLKNRTASAAHEVAHLAYKDKADLPAKYSGPQTDYIASHLGSSRSDIEVTVFNGIEILLLIAAGYTVVASRAITTEIQFILFA